MPDISVVIPTRNRPGLLGRCLASLCAQTLDPARFEICVVNNGAAELAAKVIALVNHHYPAIRVFMVDEPKLGVAQARNSGTAQTTAPLIAHSDDDATLPPDWLENLLAGFAGDGKIGKIGGGLTPVWATPRPDWLSDKMLALLDAITETDRPAGLTTSPLSLVNGCYRREALAEAEGFPTSLGRKGNNLLTGENAVDLVIAAKRWKLHYDPSIKAEHHIEAGRLQPAWLRRAAFWQGVSDHAQRLYLQKHGVMLPPAAKAELPLGRDSWMFINNAEEIPSDESLTRLRGLGVTLAASGFMPVG